MGVILGFSAFFHDSSACIVRDGIIVAAVEEERFTRKKHDNSFPENAIRYCLSEAAIEILEIDEVVFFEKPFTRFERMMDTFVKRSPAGFLPFRKSILSWIREKFWVEDRFRRNFNYSGTFLFAQHHLTHAVTACSQSDFDAAAFLVVDGVGERSCTSFGVYKDGKVHPLSEQRFPHSIGLFYAAFTQYCGFKVNSGEYKLMGLAPYGQPRFAHLIRQHLVKQENDGSIALDLRYFGFTDDLRMINRKFERLFGKPAAKPDQFPDVFYCDVAASAQQVIEELLLELMRSVQTATGMKRLAFGGGVAMNCVATARILQETPFEEVFIHSASGDSGCAIGAAIWRAMERGEFEPQQQKNLVFTGPEFAREEIRNTLKKFPGICYHEPEHSDFTARVASALAEEKIVGWFQGRMEFGARALGNRSILASARNPEMKGRLNRSVKKREDFRPFAPLVPAEYFTDYFEDAGYDYSRMLYVAKAVEGADIAACVHVDGTSRVQRLEQKAAPDLYRLIEKYKELTGSAVLINTSFNERGEPMVCTPADALNCFFNTGIDLLAIGPFLVYKSENAQLDFQKRIYEPD